MAFILKAHAQETGAKSASDVLYTWITQYCVYTTISWRQQKGLAPKDPFEEVMLKHYKELAIKIGAGFGEIGHRSRCKPATVSGQVGRP